MESHDAIWHVRRVYEMFAMLKEGYFPVRWGLTLDNYFGIPIFNFVYVLPYYFAAALQYAGFGMLASYNLSFLFAYLAGGLGIYFLLGKNQLIGITSALLYLMVPYQFLDIFVRGAIGETFFFGTFPWVMLCIKEIKEKGILKWYHPIPLALALLSHNFLGLIFLILSTLYVILFVQAKKAAFTSFFLAILLSAFFLLPMIVERGLLLSTAEGSSTFNYAQHFVYLKQLIYSPWVYVGSFPGISPLDISFQLGLANILLFLFSLIAVIKVKNTQIGLLLLLVICSIYSMLPQSEWLWKLVTPMQILQFPWRLLAITTLATPLLAGWLMSLIDNKKVLFGSALILLALASYNIRNYRRPVGRYDQAKFMEKYQIFKDKTASAARSEFTPKWSPVEKYAPDNNGLYPSKFIGIHTGPTKLSLVSEKPGEIVINTNAENERAVAVIYRNYFPSWKAELDGKEQVAIKPGENGEILVPLTPGEHSYRVYLDETPLEKFANFLTLIGLSGMIYLWVKEHRYS